MKDVESQIDRLPPQNIEAEQSILGAILIDNEALPKALEVIDSDDFYKQSHRKIFRSMVELFDRNEPIDLITLTDYMKRSDELDTVGGVSYLSSLVNMVPTAANIKYHSKIVREQGLLRSLLRSATEIASKLGNVLVSNIVMLGAYLAIRKLFSVNQILDQLSVILKGKKENLFAINKQALESGMHVTK